jgi:hypothetical protein
VSDGTPDRARQLDRFAEAGNCLGDRAPVDRPQLGRYRELTARGADPPDVAGMLAYGTA